MVSAIKVEGVPLYKLARKGQEVERQPRFIHIYSFRFSAYEEPVARFRLACTKGTYVRTVAHELGQKLGCGAHLLTLRRLVSGKFDVADAHRLDQILQWTEAELAKNGFMPLVHRKNSDLAAFIGAQSLHKPAEYSDPDATANANLGARLPYLFATCRFAHYLKCIVRDRIGSFASREDMERWLSKWINQYVDGNPSNSSEETKARKPLAAAEVVVQEVEGNPGYYTSKFFLRPHYQLEGLTVSLRLVSKLPSAKGG